MKLAIFQGPEQAADPGRNLDMLIKVADSAAQSGAHLLICPEMFLTGYNIGAAAVRELAEPATGSWAQSVTRMAQSAGIAILYGYPERGEDGRIYNAAQLIDRDGRMVLAYRKTHLFGDIDRAAFSAGATVPEIATLDGMKIGIVICYDVESPEIVRSLALKGADLIAVPTALMQPFDIVADTVIPTRAYENQVFMAYANHCGAEGDLTYCGLSCIVAPDGSDLARCKRGQELIIADLDMHQLAESRKLNTHLKDRRPDLYGALVKDVRS